MKRIVSVISVLLALLMVFTACGQGSTSSTAQPAGDSASQQQAKEGEAVTLTLMESITSPQRTAIIREMCDKFEAENPGVKVEIISPPYDGADQKITQMLMAKQPMDVLEVRDHTYTQYKNNKWIAPLNTYLEGWDGFDTLTDTAKFYMSSLGDETYFIPYGFFQKGLYYRKDWFDEAGLKAPKTWDELVDTAIKLTDPSKNRYGYSFRGAQGVCGYLDMMTQANVGSAKLANPVAAYYLKDKKSTIYGTPEAVAAAELLKKLYKEGSPKDSIAWGFPEMVQGFVGGTTAMLIQDPEVIATCTADMAEGTWALAPLPVGSSKEALVATGYAGWGITSYTPNAELAAKLVMFLSSAENNTYFNEHHSLIPIHTTAAEKDFFKNGPFAGYMEMSLNPDIYHPVTAPNMYQAYGEFYVTADEWVQRFLQDDANAADMLKIFDDFWSKAITDEGVLF